MKLPQTMIDRACKAYWAEAGTFVSTEERIHAALEAALSGCATARLFFNGADVRLTQSARLTRLCGDRVALVVLED